MKPAKDNSSKTLNTTSSQKVIKQALRLTRALYDAGWVNDSKIGKTLARDTLYVENLPTKSRSKIPNVIMMNSAILESRNILMLERLVKLIEDLLRDISVCTTV